MSNSGLNFAQAQLEKYGWSEGKGLGREEGGITEAIKPKLKFNSTGLGYDMGEQFKFQWWDHVFNKAADNITVEKDEDGSVQLQQSRGLEVSTKRQSMNKPKTNFYGAFVKGGTLVGQDERDNSDSSDMEDDRSLKLTDEQLFKICKGRTAHKGARHGLNMTAKLARVKEQELLLMEEWGAAQPAQVIQPNDELITKKKKKSKKNKAERFVEPDVKHFKKRKDKTLQHEGMEETLLEDTQDLTDINLKKNKKTKMPDDNNTELCDNATTKKKKKKKRKHDKL